jgi:uncharacterized membrane protein required for colicin V production
MSVVMIATLLIMLACGYAQYRNGLFSSFAMLIMVFLSGLVAFGFWEPIADLLDPVFQNNAMAGTEDMIVLLSLFSVTLLILRVATNRIAPEMIEENGIVQHFGAAAVGLVTGYFLAGFLLCAMQTAPLDERFLDFEPRSGSEPVYRSIYPSDRVWLSLMRYAGSAPFSWKEDPMPTGTTNVDHYKTFDQSGTFELRYLRYRRGAMLYLGEFNRELGKQKPR